MAQIGYDHKDTGETFYFKYPFKNYPNLIHNLTNLEVVNKPLLVKFEHTKSIYSLKYAVKFQNLLSYQVNPKNDKNYLQTLNLNLKLLQKNKLIKLVNFDILPVINLTIQNQSSKLPFNVGFKFGKYQASRVQHFDNNQEYGSYDFSKVLKSMLPFYRTGVRIGYSDEYELNYKGKEIQLITKYMCAVNRIHNYEDNLKLSSYFKIYFDLFEELGKKFRIQVSDELHIKKAFLRNNKKIKSESSGNYICKEYKDYHVLSGYECHSKLLEMNVLNIENVIDNGSDFYIQNVSTFRLKDIPGLKNKEVFSRLSPYLSLESIFLPSYKIIKNKHEFDFKNSFRFIYTIGISIALNKYMHIDFAMYTGASKNTKIKKEHLNRFRMNLSI